MTEQEIEQALLETCKKGLMQQICSSPEEVEA
jgi:hypothetical protein